jgi:hypothetical protein
MFELTIFTLPAFLFDYLSQMDPILQNMQDMIKDHEVMLFVVANEKSDIIIANADNLFLSLKLWFEKLGFKFLKPEIVFVQENNIEEFNNNIKLSAAKSLINQK